ncbi:MAG: hypothetical protein EBX40_00530, partial [Gammaproteobacteria bacterium]|nr:hypothetical protein [Gammaproteobacteria bacterium]
MAIGTGTALLIAGTAAAAGTVASGAMQASAQGKIAAAQGSAAERMRQEALVFAAPTAQELENLSKQVALYDRMYSQQTAVIDQLEEQSLNNAVNRLGSLQQTQGAAGSTVFNAYSGMSNLLSNIQTGMGNIQSRQVNAATLSAQPIIGTAGSQYVSQMGTAKAIGEGFSQAGKLASNYLMYDALTGG